MVRDVRLCAFGSSSGETASATIVASGGSITGYWGINYSINWLCLCAVSWFRSICDAAGSQSRSNGFETYRVN